MYSRRLRHVRAGLGFRRRGLAGGVARLGVLLGGAEFTRAYAHAFGSRQGQAPEGAAAPAEPMNRPAVRLR